MSPDRSFEAEPSALLDWTYRGLQFALLNLTTVKGSYNGAHKRVRRLRDQIRELEIQITQAEALIGEALIPTWPPLPDPVRPPTLHEAIRIVLEAKANGWITTGKLAREIAKRRLYRRRDGLAASTKDVSARVSSYPGLFERRGAVVRLRDVPPPSDDYLAAIRPSPSP
jgi:hypothetical protein